MGGEKEIEWEGEGVNVEDRNFGGVFCIYSCHVVPYQGVWTKVAQHNKFRVSDFNFASLWT